MRLTKDQVAQGIQKERDLLLVIAGDKLNQRAVKLGRSVKLGDHLLNQWDLALVETSVFKRQGDSTGPDFLFVPHILGAIQVEKRQTVKVTVEGDKTRVELVRSDPERAVWTGDTFLAALEGSKLPPAMKRTKPLRSG